MPRSWSSICARLKAACRSSQARHRHVPEQYLCSSRVARNGSEHCSQIRGCWPTILAFRSRVFWAAAARSRQRSHSICPSGAFSAGYVMHWTQWNTASIVAHAVNANAKPERKTR
jgi:hypothetical protein